MKRTKPESTRPEGELSTKERFAHDLDKVNLVIVEMLKDQNTDASSVKQAWSIRAALIEDFVDSIELDPNNPVFRSRV